MNEHQQQQEWEAQVCNNLKALFACTGGDGTGLTVDGASAKQKHGLVLICGGYQQYSNDSTSTEIYDSTNDSVRKGPDMNVARCAHASVTLPNGDIAVFGGYSGSTNPTIFVCLVKCLV